MLCRLCLVDDNNYQKIEGAICDMLRAVLRKNCIEVNNPVLCSNCVKKLEKAFDFKTTCLRTQKILSLYGGRNNKIVYIRDNKLCLSPKNDLTLKLCRTCLKLIEQGFCSNLLTRYDILEKLPVYIPEIVIGENETSHFCYKCSDNFRIFSELVNVVSKTESVISNYCIDNEVMHAEELSLDELFGKKETQNSTEDSNIMKLLDGNQQLLLDLENDFESTYLDDNMEDSKKRIIKKIIEEDVDLFYKEIPDFDVHDSFSEEIGMDSECGNIFFRPQQSQLLLSDSEEEIQQKRIRESIEEEEGSVRLSFETEESSLSPGTINDRHFYECESQDERKKDEREVTSPNPFIFFNEYSRNDSRCSCDDNTIETTPQSKTKRKWCEKCKSKTTNGSGGGGDSTPDDDDDEDVATKRPKKDGKKKCRKMYGIEFKDLWCTRCRWKKACSRFGNTKAVSRR